MSENKKDMNEIVNNTLSEIEGFVEAASAMENVERQFDEAAGRIGDEARALVEAQNAVDNATEEKPFKPSRKDKELFMEVEALVQAQNDIDNGLLQADPHLKKEIDERFEPDEWNPETVIDEKIKEEQDEGVSRDLRDEIVEGMENM